jgi:hypothetical protein
VALSDLAMAQWRDVSRVGTVASDVGTRWAQPAVPAVETTPATSRESLTVNGTPCSGNSCPGWQRLDNNPKTKAIAAQAKLRRINSQIEVEAIAVL